MAISTNRTKNSKLSKAFSLIFRLICKNSLVSLLVFSFVLFYVLKENNYSNKVVLEISGSLYDNIEKFKTHLITPFSTLSKHFNTLKVLQIENERLTNEVAELHSKLQNFDLIQNHNLELKKLLNFIPSLSVDHVSARLLSINSSVEGNYGIIGAGGNSEIQVNNLVVCEKGLIGKVVQVSPNYSKVLLITNSKFRIPILTSSGQRGIFVGDGNTPHILYISDPGKLTEQELVVTAGEEYALIPDIPVARIISDNDNNLKIKAKIEVALDNISFVSVLKTKNLGQ
jgi:rod shape-determining protein MreC